MSVNYNKKNLVFETNKIANTNRLAAEGWIKEIEDLETASFNDAKIIYQKHESSRNKEQSDLHLMIAKLALLAMIKSSLTDKETEDTFNSIDNFLQNLAKSPNSK